MDMRTGGEPPPNDLRSLLDERQRIAELLGAKEGESLVHALRNVLSEVALLRALCNAMEAKQAKQNHSAQASPSAPSVDSPQPAQSEPPPNADR